MSAEAAKSDMPMSCRYSVRNTCACQSMTSGCGQVVLQVQVLSVMLRHRRNGQLHSLPRKCQPADSRLLSKEWSPKCPARRNKEYLSVVKVDHWISVLHLKRGNHMTPHFMRHQGTMHFRAAPGG